MFRSTALGEREKGRYPSTLYIESSLTWTPPKRSQLHVLLFKNTICPSRRPDIQYTTSSWEPVYAYLSFPHHHTAALPPLSLVSTFTLCALFLRWTSNFCAEYSGPGVYCLPGQSVQRMRGMK